MSLPLRVLASLGLGYLLGSLSPAYLIRHWPRVDGGSGGEPSGLALPALTVIFDAFKGVAAILASQGIFGLPESLIAFPAAAAITGHMLSFIVGFHGGNGIATAAGILLWSTALEAAAGRFSPVSYAVIAGVGLASVLASHSAHAAGLLTVLFVGIVTPFELGLTRAAILDLAILGFLFATLLASGLKSGLFRFSSAVELSIWRLAARPFALLFIPIDLLWGRRTLLIVVGVLALIFIFTDLFRFVSKRRLSLLFKKGEEKRFSSMTLFLISVFMAFLAFQGAIPYLGLAFTTVGDLFGKLFGIRFGAHRLYKLKTWEGSLGFLCGSLMTGYTLSLLVRIPMVFVFAGSVFAAFVELFSELLDDNFSVCLLSSGFLAALRYFLGV